MQRRPTRVLQQIGVASPDRDIVGRDRRRADDASHGEGKIVAGAVKIETEVRRWNAKAPVGTGAHSSPVEAPCTRSSTPCGVGRKPQMPSPLLTQA